jgi:hypothetical protein
LTHPPMPVYAAAIPADGMSGVLERVASIGGVAASPAGAQPGFGLAASIAAIAASADSSLLLAPAVG